MGPVTEDQTQTVSVVPSPRFVLFVFSSVFFVPGFLSLLLAVRGSLRRRSRLSHPAVRGSSRRRSRLSHPAVRRSWRRRSRLCHPAVRGSSRRRSRINQPTVHRRWRHHPRLTLAHRPAADSMPAGLPLTQCPPACLWLKLSGLPLTQARWIAADSSSPDCRWLMPAGRRWQGKPIHFRSSRRRLRLTDPAVRGRSRRRPWGKPTHRRRLPLVSRGKPTRRPRFTRPAAGWGSLQPAGPCRCVVKPAGCCRYLSSQPVMVSPAGRCRIDKPAGRGRIWPDSDQGLFNCLCVFSPGGLLIPLSFPKEILGGGSRAPAEETEVGAGAAVSEAVPPWPPELPAPPWPPELPAPPWPPELPAPPGPRSVCSTLEAPSCVCISVGPVGSPECPPPLPGSTVTARDVPSGRGSYVRDLSCASCGSRLLFLYLVCFLSVVIIVYSCHLLC